MIYLIGGTPRSGKTTLAKKIAKVLNAQYISTDVLRLFMVATLKAPEKYDYFPFEKMFDASSGVSDFYKVVSGDNMLDADIEEAENLMPGIIALLNYLSGTGENYVIEGVHFLPVFAQEFSKKEGYKVVILTKKDSDKIYKGLKVNQGKGDWIADNIQDDKILLKAAESLSAYGKYFEQESEKRHTKYINMEDGFIDKLEEAMGYLTQ